MSTTTAAQVGAQATSNPPPGNPPSASQMAAFAAAIRTLESGSPQGNYAYTEVSPTGCRGAYQVCNPTFLNGDPTATNPVEKGGLAGCGVTLADPASWNTPAGIACQDSVAQAWFADWYQQGFSWEQIANIWNTGSSTAGYGASAVNLYNQYLGNPTQTATYSDYPGEGIVKGAASAVGNAASDAASAAASGAAAILKAEAETALKGIGLIFPSNFLKRVAMGAGGIALIIGGVTIFLASTKPGQEAVSTGAAAAALAA